MVKVFARIGMELVLTDKEAKELLKEAGSYYDGEKILNNELDINRKFAARFLKDGTLSDDSYIPEGSIEI